MKKPAIILTVIGSVLVIVAIAYYITSIKRVNTLCIYSLEPLSLDIYEYRDANGNWPDNILAFPDDIKKTARGVPIIYNRDSLQLTAECAHPGIPILDRLDYRLGVTNYYSISSHAIRLKIGYEHWKKAHEEN